MKRSTTKTLLAITLATATAVMLAGCAAQGSNDKKWTKAANNRWLGMRSQLIYNMAKQQFESGDLGQAEKSVENGLEVAPNDARLQLLAGQIALEKGKLERAYHLFGSVMALDKKEDKAYYLQGVILQRWQQYKDAYQRYQEAYNLKKDNVGYVLAMAEMLVPMNRTNDAIHLLAGKVSYFDENAAIRAELGHLYAMQGQYAKAVDVLQQASMLAPDNLQVQEELGLNQLQAGDTEDAINTLSVLLKNPKLDDRIDVQRELATAYQKDGRINDARNMYISLTQNDSSDPMDWIKLAELCWHQGDLDATLEAANQIIDIAPQKPDGYLLAGMVWQKRHDLGKALNMFDQAAKAAPNNPEPLLLRGLSLQQAGRQAAAEQAYRQAMRRDPSDHRAKELLDGIQGAKG